MIFRQLFDKESSTYTYLLGDEATRDCALVDPVFENVARDLSLIKELGLELRHVLDTHVHADHVTGAGELRKRTGAHTYVSKDGGAPCADRAVGDGDIVDVGSIVIRAIATPGHTSGCMSFIVTAPNTLDRVLTGDALFVRGCGRTDFQEGDPGRLYDSVTQKLFVLPQGTLVYPAHDYRGMTVSTIGEERDHNPRLKDGTTRDAFVTIMRALDLPPPAKMHEAVPANRACGERPS